MYNLFKSTDVGKKSFRPASFKQVLFYMKISVFLTFIFVGLAYSNETYGQNALITLNVKNQTISEVLEKIEAQSNYSFFYNNKEIDVSRFVFIKVENKQLREVLDILFSDTNIQYSVLGNSIILTNREIVLSTSGKARQGIPVTGTVSDNFGGLMPGVTVNVRGSNVGVSTDGNGEFNITVPSDSSVLQFRFVGYRTQEIVVGNRRIIAVSMQEESADLGEVTIVAFGTQKKQSVIGSVSTLNPVELKIPSSNLTTAMAGRIGGVIAYQRSGEPGVDNAEFFIRGVTTFGYKTDPLILVDGMELTTNDLARLQVDDIASFSIMKDATATALYGARGANGVILITTKEGREGPAKINFRFENSFSSPTQMVKFADPITYMKLHNKAVATRDPLATTPYSMQKVAYTEQGVNPYVYPAVDWYDMMFKKVAVNQRANLSISGGGQRAQYYVAATYSKDQGNLKTDRKNNFNNNININRYLLRSNVNIQLTKSTEMIVRLHGTMDDYSGPLESGTILYNKAVQSSPVYFAPYYPADDAHSYAEYTCFGNYDDALYINPYAQMVRGYRDTKTSLMLAQFELKQKLNFITEGLNIRAMFNTNRRGNYGVSRAFNPYYFNIGGYNQQQDKYTLAPLNTSGTDYLESFTSQKDVITSTYFETALNYDHTFGKHGVSGLLVYIMQDNLTSKDANELQLSLPSRNLGISGRFTYSFDTRYFAEFNFGYNGSERFSEQERFGFFPSAGFGWVISNENFWGESFKKNVNNLKLKFTYGLVGNDAIGDEKDRFFYLSQVNINDNNYGNTFGVLTSPNRISGVSIARNANPKITWETSRKTNLGLEVGLFNELELQVDLFHDYRYNILMSRSYMPETMGLSATERANIGEASSRGVDLSLQYNKSLRNGLWLSFMGNFTYATNRYEVYEEPSYIDSPWLSHIGYPIHQQWGYVAQRMFVDDYEVANSPLQSFGEYRGGDLKYVDINKDGQISTLDRVPIGYPTTPEIQYGFGISAGWKGFDLSFFFQGTARESFWINSSGKNNNTSPFINNTHSSNNDNRQDPVSKAYLRGQNQLLKVYADSHWSESNRDVYALWPRLSDVSVSNNMQTNTWFMRDGSFMRLKTLEFGYSLPEKIVNRAKMSNLRIYYSGNNLLCFSKFKLWDPEMAGNGLGYPLQRVHNIGINFTF